MPFLLGKIDITQSTLSIFLICKFRWYYLLPLTTQFINIKNLDATLTVHASTNSISLPIKKSICFFRMGNIGINGQSRHYTWQPILPKSPNISLPVRIYYQTPFNKQINKLLTDLPNKSPLSASIPDTLYTNLLSILPNY